MLLYIYLPIYDLSEHFKYLTVNILFIYLSGLILIIMDVFADCLIISAETISNNFVWDLI